MMTSRVKVILTQHFSSKHPCNLSKQLIFQLNFTILRKCHFHTTLLIQLVTPKVLLKAFPMVKCEG